MSTLYKVEITTVDGPRVELNVRAMQPDSSPLYDTKRFALALLCGASGHEGSQLAEELPPESVIAVSEGEVDPSPYVDSVQLEKSDAEHGYYTIVMTSAAWTEHLKPGVYDSVAWDHISDMEAVKRRRMD